MPIKVTHCDDNCPCLEVYDRKRQKRLKRCLGACVRPSLLRQASVEAASLSVAYKAASGLASIELPERRETQLQQREAAARCPLRHHTWPDPPA